MYLYIKLEHFLIGDNKGGIRKSELVAWYLDQIQDQLNSEGELLERKNFIEKIIDRLTYHVCIDIFIYCIIVLYIFRIYNHLLHEVNSLSGPNYNTSNNDQFER